jgi:hypothetical protein
LNDGQPETVAFGSIRVRFSIDRFIDEGQPGLRLVGRADPEEDW